MIIDWNRTTLRPRQVFYFKGSTHPFVEITPNGLDDGYFLDLITMKFYNCEDIYESDEMSFYTIDDDEDFMGVFHKYELLNWSVPSDKPIGGFHD